MENQPSKKDHPRPSELPRRPQLPDPLETTDGEMIETAEEWYDRRRPELKELFEHYVYGYAPEPPAIETTVDRRGIVLDGRAELREVTIRFTDCGDDTPTPVPTIDLALVTPRGNEPVPVFLGLNREGNHATLADESVTVTDSGEQFGADTRGERSQSWCVERIVERGYGFATFHHADVDPDRDNFTDGIHAQYPDLDGPSQARWGTLRAWAWGLQRGVDYLQTADHVRDEGIAVIGHSRRGKATLLAGAFDQRIDLVVPHQSGTGGCALSRQNNQETVAKINETFPHWFNDVFPAFSGRVSRLPVDQHLLFALVAPRPILDTEGSRDYWANPGLAYDAMQAAQPVYELLDATGTIDEGLRYGDEPITTETAGELLQYRRETGHTLNREYWDAILDFADVHLG